MMKIFRIPSLLILVIVSSCQAQPSGTKIENIQTAQEVKQILNDEIQILDVRTYNEYSQGHLAGAVLITLQDPDFALKVSQLDKSKPVMVYCAVGGRSTSAVNQMATMGFNKIYNFKGGMQNWMSSGMEVTKE